MDLATAYDQKRPLRQLDVKTNVTLVQTLLLIILDILPGNHSRVIGACILMQ